MGILGEGAEWPVAQSVPMERILATHVLQLQISVKVQSHVSHVRTEPNQMGEWERVREGGGYTRLAMCGTGGQGQAPGPSYCGGQRRGERLGEGELAGRLGIGRCRPRARSEKA